MNTRKIILEEIIKILQEGYAAQKPMHKEVCLQKANEIIEFVKNKLKNNNGNDEKASIPCGMLTIRVLFHPFDTKKNTSGMIKAHFTVENGSFSSYLSNGYIQEYPIIFMEIDSNITVQKIYRTLLHETTHYLDWITRKSTNYKRYNHQTNWVFFNQQNINQKVASILYFLWDNTEFNAYQSNGQINTFINNLYNMIEDVYYDNTIDWNAVKEYLVKTYSDNETKNKQITKNTSLEKVKKYFIETSMALLKKFIKKIPHTEFYNNNI